MMLNSVIAISEGAKLMFIMDDKSIYELNSLSYEISSRGAGATGVSGSNTPGINIQYISNEDEDFTVLRDKLVAKMRIYTTDGYIDSEIEESDAKVLQNAIILITD